VKHGLRPLLAYLGLAAVLLGPLILHATTRLPDDGDAPQGLWIVWWGAHHLLEPARLLDANAYYPHPHGLLYSEPMLAEAILGWPLFQLFPANPVLVVNLLAWLTLGMSGWACHLLYRELSGSDLAAWLGACVCVFNAYTFLQLPRLQLVTLQWMFLALFALHRAFTRGERWASVLFGVAVLLQGLACLYYAVFLALAAGVLVPTYLLATRNGRALAGIVVAGAVSVALTAPLVSRFVDLYRLYGFSGQGVGNDLASYFRPPAPTLLQPDIVPLTSDAPFLGYAGLVLASLGLAVLARAPRGRAVVAGYAVLGILAFLLSGGATLTWRGATLAPGPFAALASLPAFQTLRVPGRVSILVAVAFGALVATGAAWLLPRLARRRGLASAIAGVVLLVEQWPVGALSGEPIPTGRSVPAAYRWLSEHADGSPVAELPPRPSHQVRWLSLDAYFSTYHGSPILFARPSFSPPAMEYLGWRLREFPDDGTVTLLQALGVRRVIVHPRRWTERQRFRLKRLARHGGPLRLEASFEDRDDPSFFRYGLGGEQILLLEPLAAEQEVRACACREIDPRTLRAEASAGRPRSTLDRDRTTVWRSGERAEEQSALEVRLERPTMLARIEIELSHPYSTFPRELVIEGGLGSVSAPIPILPDVWADIELVRQLVADPSRARLRYDLEPTLVDNVRLTAGVPEPGLNAWSVPEIHLLESVSSDEVSAARK
jgi:hypothetical protein